MHLDLLYNYYHLSVQRYTPLHIWQTKRTHPLKTVMFQNEMMIQKLLRSKTSTHPHAAHLKELPSGCRGSDIKQRG